MFNKIRLLFICVFGLTGFILTRETVYAVSGNCPANIINPDIEAKCTMTYDDATREFSAKSSVSSGAPAIGLYFQFVGAFNRIATLGWGVDYTTTLPEGTCGKITCALHYRYKNGTVCTIYANGHEGPIETGCLDACYRNPAVFCGINSDMCRRDNFMSVCTGTSGCIWPFLVVQNQSLPSWGDTITIPCTTPTPTSTATPTMIPSPTLIPTLTPTPTLPAIPEYFQVKGGDIHAPLSNTEVPLSVNLPDSTRLLNDVNDQQSGSAGVFSTDSDFPYNLGSNPGVRLSATNWYAKNVYNPNTRIYDYNYFETNLTNVQSLPPGTAFLNGSFLSGILLIPDKVYKINGDLMLEGDLSPGLASQVFLVEGNLYINSDFSVGGNTETYPVFIIKNNILINSGVSKIGGIFFTDGYLDTGVDNNKLILENGTVIALTPPTGLFNLRLNRTSPVVGEAAETFIYDPTYLVKLAKILGYSEHLWQERGN